MPTKKQKKLYKDAPPDHAGHAECVLATFPDEFKYTPTHGWFVYVDTHWDRVIGDIKIRQAVRNVLRERSKIAMRHNNKKLQNKSSVDQWTVNGVVNTLQSWPEVATTSDKFDNEPFLLNCANGTLDLRTLDLSPHSPKNMLTYCLETKYELTADKSEWLKFLKSCGHSDEVIDYMQHFFGYCLTGSTRDEVLTYFRGASRSGKGVTTETFTHLLGTLAQGVNFRMFTADRSRDTQNFDMAPLKNKRFIVAGEQNRQEGLNEATIKMITGGDLVYCAYKHKNHFAYRPQYKVVLTSNHYAYADAADTAVWGRLRIVPFEKSFLGKEDKDLKRKLLKQENLEGVLAWAAAGAYRWYLRGHLPYPQIMKDELKINRANASTVMSFVKDECELDPNAVIVISALYAEYKSYCSREGYGHIGRPRFKNEMYSIYKMSEERRRMGVNQKMQRVYLGIKLL